MSWFTSDDRLVFRNLADHLIPADGDLPCASAVGVADALLDKVINVRPDLAPLLLRAIRIGKTTDERTAIEKLRDEDPEAFEAIKLATAAGYYMSPDVRAALGYNGVERHSYNPDSEPEFQRLGLLGTVQGRGPSWREDPRPAIGH